MPLGSAPAQPLPARPTNDWAPYMDRVSFELAELLYTKEQMSAGNIDALLGLWEASQLEHNCSPPFHSHRDMYNTIDATSQGIVTFEVPLHYYYTILICILSGGVNWQCFSLNYQGELTNDSPPWMKEEYEVHYRDARDVVLSMVLNPEFADEIDFGPFQERDEDGQHRLKDFMSSDWAWRQAVCDFYQHRSQLACSHIWLQGRHLRKYGV